MPKAPPKLARTIPETPMTLRRVAAVVKKIPEGKVATYGQVARLAGFPGRARQVGYALHSLDAAPVDMPWHRVVNARGEISYSLSRAGGDEWQFLLLQQEGIVFSKAGKIDLRLYQWRKGLDKI